MKERERIPFSQLPSMCLQLRSPSASNQHLASRRPRRCSALHLLPQCCPPAPGPSVCLSIPHPWDEMAALSGASPTEQELWHRQKRRQPPDSQPSQLSTLPHPWMAGLGFFSLKRFLSKSPHIPNPAEQEPNRRTPTTVHHGPDLPTAGRFPRGSTGQPGTELMRGSGRSLGARRFPRRALPPSLMLLRDRREP